MGDTGGDESPVGCRERPLRGVPSSGAQSLEDPSESRRSCTGMKGTRTFTSSYFPRT